MTTRWKFFKENGELRARLVNPPLIIANGKPKRRKKNMAKTITMRRNKRGQFVAVSRSSNPRPHHRKKNVKKHHARRHNYVGAGAVVPMNPRKRRRNPPTEVLGVPIPNMQDSAEMAIGVASGLAGPPIANGLITNLLPASITSTLGTAGPTLIKLASYLIPPLAANAIGGRQAAKYVIAGELAGLLVPVLSSLTASISGSLTPQVAGYTQRGRVGFSGFGRAAVQRHHGPGFRGYLAPGASKQLSAFPGIRSLSRNSRFISPRR